jgi:hypothetical protein
MLAAPATSAPCGLAMLAIPVKSRNPDMKELPIPDP